MIADETATFQLNKLVRDRLPEIMRGLGEEPDVTYLQGDELYLQHVRKIIEEYSELKKLDPMLPSYVKELADLAEATDAFIEKFGEPNDSETANLINEVQSLIRSYENQEALAECRAKRKAERGGFSDGAYVGKLVLQAGDTWVEYYREDPERFPEL